MLKVYRSTHSLLKSILRTSAEYFGLETKLKGEPDVQGDSDTNNNTIYSILNDCRDMSIVKRSRPTDLNLHHEEEIGLEDFSNFVNRSVLKKRESTICLTVDSKMPADLPFQDRKMKAAKLPLSGCREKTNHHNIYFEPSPPLKFQASQNSSSISRIRSKSPNKRDSKTNFDEEFSRLFHGQNHLVPGECSFTNNKSSAQTTKQSTITVNMEHESKEQAFIYRDARDSGLELVQTSCFGGQFPLISFNNHQRNFSKERATSINKPKSQRGNLSQVGINQKENIQRGQMSFISSKSRPQKKEISHLRLQSNTIIQDISQEEVESPNHTEEIEIYVPKGMRKKKKDSLVLSKVDHRRERSPLKTNPPVAVLDKQFKSAKIATFESVMQSLKGSHAR